MTAGSTPILRRAAERALAEGTLDATDYNRLATFDWQGLLNSLLPFLAIIPGIGPLLPLIAKLIPFLIDALNQIPNVTPVVPPIVPPVVPPDVGPIPDPN